MLFSKNDCQKLKLTIQYKKKLRIKMSKYVYYVISDIHLERKNEYQKQFLLDAINKVINDNTLEKKRQLLFFLVM